MMIRLPVSYVIALMILISEELRGVIAACTAVTPNSGTEQTFGKAPYNNGETVTMGCLAGYSIISGEPTATCQSNNWQWGTTDVQLTCAADCSPVVPQNNTVLDTAALTVYRHGATIRIKCLAGYASNNGGSADATCNNGAWRWGTTDIRMACIKGCAAPTISTADIQVNGGPMPGYLVGAFTYAVCNTGYAYQSGVTNFTCLSNYTWATTGNTAKCIQVCTLPTLSEGVEFLTTSATTYVISNTTRVKCSAGYVLSSGNDTAICTAGNTWTWQTPGQLRCVQTCTLPTLPLDITLVSSATKTYVVNNTITVKCSALYTYGDGNDTAVCSTNNTWVWKDDGMLHCLPICLPPALPASLTAVSPTTGTYLVGSNFTVACNTSYVYNNGNSTATCMPNNVWQWMGGGRLNCVPTCAPLQPGLYANLTSATNQSLYIQNDAAEFTCYDGYVYAAGGYRGTCVGLNTWSWTNGATAPLKCIVAPAYASATASFFASTTCSNYVSRPATNDASCLISCLYDTYCSGYAMDSSGCRLDRPQLEPAVTAIPCLSRG